MEEYIYLSPNTELSECTERISNCDKHYLCAIHSIHLPPGTNLTGQTKRIITNVLKGRIRVLYEFMARFERAVLFFNWTLPMLRVLVSVCDGISPSRNRARSSDLMQNIHSRRPATPHAHTHTRTTHTQIAQARQMWPRNRFQSNSASLIKMDTVDFGRNKARPGQASPHRRCRCMHENFTTIYYK